MKENLTHIVFVIDESGSMCSTALEVISGFNKFIKEQKELLVGDMMVSLYKFSTNVEKVFDNRNVKDVEDLTTKTYSPGGLTALYDGIGTAIDETGKYLASLVEENRPSKVLFVIMTDGEENSSSSYRLAKIKDMIQLQENTYNWTFMYMGANLKDAKEAKSLGIVKTAFFDSKDATVAYDGISHIASCYRCCRSAVADQETNLTLNKLTAEYEENANLKISNRNNLV